MHTYIHTYVHTHNISLKTHEGTDTPYRMHKGTYADMRLRTNAVQLPSWKAGGPGHTQSQRRLRNPLGLIFAM